ncbi:MAG: SDR family NAD(P)-dependent oxidoreductase [Lachnospiraceae bacterium]|nr:SDR family NAD(P)-dependent oxidoreductase [Lachnospiraceae bacterium]
MKIAIVTGASSGMGREFVRQISEDYVFLDEIWVIARNAKKLKSLRREVDKRLVILPLDLRKREDQEMLRNRLVREEPRIKLLVNAAGIGKIGDFAELSLDSQRAAVRLNCEGLTAVTYLCLPFMHPGSRLIQMSSAAAFIPQPGFAVYAATKSYVLSFSRALRTELRPRGITVTSVCPGPVDTPFFDKAEKLHSMAEFKKSFMAAPEDVVEKAIRDAAVGRELSIYGGGMKTLFAAGKLLPHCFLIWLTEYINHFES